MVYFVMRVHACLLLAAAGRRHAKDSLRLLVDRAAAADVQGGLVRGHGRLACNVVADQLGHGDKGLLDVLGILGRGLEVLHAVLAGFLLCVLLATGQ